MEAPDVMCYRDFWPLGLGSTMVKLSSLTRSWPAYKLSLQSGALPMLVPIM